MTLDEIVYNIKNIVEGGISGEDSNISNRQIKNMVHYHRAQLLMQYTDMGRFLSEKLYSEISGNIPNNGMITAPEVIGFPNNRAYVSISVWPSGWNQQADDRMSVPIHDNADKEFMSESRFTGNSLKAYIRGGAIRFYEGNDLYTDTNSLYLIKAVLSKPEDGPQEYPIPEELIPTLTSQILSVEFSAMTSVLNDAMNNSADDKMVTNLASGGGPGPSAGARTQSKRTR
jgi:hypothetical protein